jgi:hypothetical protein
VQVLRLRCLLSPGEVEDGLQLAVAKKGHDEALGAIKRTDISIVSDPLGIEQEVSGFIEALFQRWHAVPPGSQTPEDSGQPVLACPGFLGGPAHPHINVSNLWEALDCAAAS